VKQKASKVYYKGKITLRGEAKELLSQPGDFVMVERETPRYLILLCPCGCGDELVINLDKRSGPAWKLYEKKGSWTLFPSYWRTTACESHFIVWNNLVYLFGQYHKSGSSWKVDDEMEERVLAALQPNHFTHYMDLAERCDLIPWECLQACEQLEEKGLCIGEGEPLKDYFKKI